MGSACLIVVVVVLTFTRIIKSVVTGQAPVSLESNNTKGKNNESIQSGTRMSPTGGYNIHPGSVWRARVRVGVGPGGI